MSEDMAYTHDTSSNLKTGNRQDWGDEIWNISNDEIPVLSQISRNDDYTSTEHKWFTEYLADRDSSDSSANVEGGLDSPSTDPRYSCINYNMIFKDSAFVSRTQEKQLKAGVFSELEHQLFNKMMVLRQSVEQAVLCRVRKRTSQENSAAGYMAGIPGLVGLYADQSAHVSGTRTYGSNNTVNISIIEDSFDQTGSATGQDEFDTMLMNLKTLGGNPSVCACSYQDKKYVSESWDIENKTRQTMEETKITKLILVYETDFGLIRFIPTLSYAKWGNVSADRFDGQGGATMITDFATLMNPSQVELQVFDDFFTEDSTNPQQDGKQRRAIFEGTLELSAPVGTGVFNFSGSSDYTRASANSRLPVTAAGYAAA